MLAWSALTWLYHLGYYNSVGIQSGYSTAPPICAEPTQDSNAIMKPIPHRLRFSNLVVCKSISQSGFVCIGFRGLI